MTAFTLPPQPGDPAQFWPVLLVCIASILLGAVCVAALLRKLGLRELDLADFLSLGLSGGGLLVVLATFPVFLFTRVWRVDLDLRAVFSVLAVGLVLGSAVLYFGSARPHPQPSRVALLLLLLAVALGFLRLPFVGSLLLPPYSDSVEHYLIVQDLLHPAAEPGAFYTLEMSARYYHFGFHILAAWVSALSHSSPLVVLPLLGQVLQVIIPLALFFLVRATTRSDAAALFTVLVAAIGWRMPAFASNWGKYPALAGMATLPFALGLAWLAHSSVEQSRKRALFAFALLAGLLATLMHTRSAVLLLLTLAAWLLAAGVLRARPRLRILVGLACAVIVAWVAFQVATDPGLLFMLAPYLRTGFFPTLFALLLVPFGLKHFPQAMLSTLLSLLLLLLAALTPMPDFLARLGYETLLDRPFAQAVFFLPLALAAGVGLAGLQRGLLDEERTPLKRGAWIFLTCGLCLLIALNGLRADDLRPASCCRLVTEDDLAAYAWMATNLPPEAVILVASEKTPTQSYGVDGGIWITPLTGLQTRKWPHNLLLDTREALEQVCARGATYIYAGGTASRFSVDVLRSRPAWYKSLFSLPLASIYKLDGCALPPR